MYIQTYIFVLVLLSCNCCNLIFRLEEDSEEDFVPIGRGRRRTKCLAIPSNIYVRRPGEAAVHVPLYHSGAIRTTKNSGTGGDDVQLLGHLDERKPESLSRVRSYYTTRVSGSKVVITRNFFHFI
jgi:hypothetical protein